jgi:hypothetical protein
VPLNGIGHPAHGLPPAQILRRGLSGQLVSQEVLPSPGGFACAGVGPVLFEHPACGMRQEGREQRQNDNDRPEHGGV